jgi:hypothetical protein
MQEQYGYPALTPAIKTAILGTNAVQLYGVDSLPAKVDDASWVEARAELARRLV